jgi:hypothetical protein
MQAFDVYLRGRLIDTARAQSHAYRPHAELMAAAPALLAALRECVKSLEYAAMVLDPPAVSTFRESITTARALLAPFERVET